MPMVSGVVIEVATRLLFTAVFVLMIYLLPMDRVGHKHSGFGFHSGIDGFHQFSIPKSLVFEPSESP